MDDRRLKKVTAYIALGSNLGDRRARLTEALSRLNAVDGIDVALVSTFHETEPVGAPGQGLFLNAAAKLHTTLSPMELLNSMLDIERAMGRKRDRSERWGPRIIDLDLLLYGDEVFDRPGLCVPHPRLHERQFVLDPLCEIAAEIMHPGLNESIESLQLAARGGVSCKTAVRRE